LITHTATASQLSCQSIAFTYNEPVIFLEYAIDTAQACHEQNIKSVAVSAGFICDKPREKFFRHMDAANIDLKAFNQHFYKHLCGGDLQAVKETLLYLKQESQVWFEITTLLIPDENDSDEELHAQCEWIAEYLGCSVPLHFSAFHPDWKMRDKQKTPAATLSRARAIALENGLQYVYTGNVHDTSGGSTYCPGCKQLVIERDWYELGLWQLNATGSCLNCGHPIAGVFDGPPGRWGAKRLPVTLTRPV
jgi:pyruvate formate lyase activating enzyme